MPYYKIAELTDSEIAAIEEAGAKGAPEPTKALLMNRLRRALAVIGVGSLFYGMLWIYGH